MLNCTTKNQEFESTYNQTNSTHLVFRTDSGYENREYMIKPVQFFGKCVIEQPIAEYKMEMD